MSVQEDGDDEGKVGLYSNAMAAQAIKPKKAAGRSQRTRRWSKNFGLLANFVFFSVFFFISAP